jgi:hypothetical protein
MIALDHPKADECFVDRGDEYAELLRSKGLWPSDPHSEQNWSGRGQHVEFRNSEVDKINQLLAVQDTLGMGVSAIVHSVKCRRILLARKTVHTNRRFTKQQAMEEVAHLARLNHAHVVRLIGTYTWKRDLMILMYPVADHNLSTFLDVLSNATVPLNVWAFMSASMPTQE